MKDDITRQIIIQRLQERFNPSLLKVFDDYQEHVNHNASGGHFRIIISAEAFVGLTKIQSHREIYQLLSDLIPGTIHALAIQIQ